VALNIVIIAKTSRKTSYRKRANASLLSGSDSKLIYLNPEIKKKYIPDPTKKKTLRNMRVTITFARVLVEKYLTIFFSSNKKKSLSIC
jgi:hypothetical protein